MTFENEGKSARTRVMNPENVGRPPVLAPEPVPYGESGVLVPARPHTCLFFCACFSRFFCSRAAAFAAFASALEAAASFFCEDDALESEEDEEAEELEE